MPVSLDDVRFAFQPIVDLDGGCVVGVEVFTRAAQGEVGALLERARADGELTGTDVALATTAIWAAASYETLLPLHLNVFAATVASGDAFREPVRQALQGTGRRPAEVVIEIVAPYFGADRPALTEQIDRLRKDGFRVAFDNIGEGDVPLTMLIRTGPDLVKIDREIIAGLPEDRHCVALVEALVHICAAAGSLVVAEGVETVDQLRTLYRLGVSLAQGDLLAPTADRPTSAVTLPAVSAALPGQEQPRLRVRELMRPALTAPLTATIGAVQKQLKDAPDAGAVVLVDEHGRPVRLLDRRRFLAAFDGSAQLVDKAAVRLGQEPRVLRPDASAYDVLDAPAGGAPHRSSTDLVVVSESGSCIGVIDARSVLESLQS